jgi:hypothetical protein
MRKTGWDPPALMQDDHGGLSRWFATRPDARYVFIKNQRRKQMKYKMEIVMSYWQTVVIEAESRADAENRALYEFDITKARMGDGEVYDTQLVFEPTPEEAAFMEAYLRNVASATQDNVLYFLEHKKDEKDHDEWWWTSVMDAWLVWQDAIRFNKGESK